MILRPYQQATAAECLRALRSGGRVCLSLPTGAGKTATASAIVAELGLRTVWGTHRDELALQARAALPKWASVVSVACRKIPPADLLVLDECHHAVSKSWARHVEAHTGPVLGLSASPFRLDGKGLGTIFDAVISATWAKDAAPVAWSSRKGSLTLQGDLCREGFLVAPDCFSIPGVTVEGLHKRAGDYAQDESAALMDKPHVVGCAIREYQTNANGTRAVAFCVTVDHAKHVAAAFNDAGIAAECVWGNMPKDDRRAALDRLRAGTTRVVTTVVLLTEGWDLPTLETVIILRPTSSLNLHLQMIGRGMRTAEGKRGAVVLDHAGNLKRLGLVTEPIPFDLDGRVVRESSATGLKTCPECYRLIPSATPVCPCGFVFGREVQGDLIVGGLGGEERLVKIEGPTVMPFVPAAWEAACASTTTIGQAKWRYKEATGHWPLVSADGRLLDPMSEEGRKRAYFELLELATKKGWNLGAAAHKYQARYGTMPPFEWKVKYEAWLTERRAANG